jgi:hypothetical protein
VFRSGARRTEASPIDSSRIDSEAREVPFSSFPERSEITTPAFFETPHKLLSRVHRGFLRLAIMTSVFVFAFWCVVYAMDLTSQRTDPATQRVLMRSNLLFGGSTSRVPRDAEFGFSGSRTTSNRGLEQTTGGSREAGLATRVRELEENIDEADYQSNKKFKEQYQIIVSQRGELNSIKSATGRLQQTLPEQISSIGSRVGAAEARAGEGVGQAEAARQAAEGVQKQLGTKITEVEARATRAAEQVGKVEDQASVLATRTEALEKELDRRARQIEARTEELGERTAGLKEREERMDRLQRVAFAAILGELKTSADELERRIAASFYRLFSKGEAKRDADALRQRIEALAAELRQMNTDQAKEFLAQLDELTKRVDKIAERIK